MAIYETRYGNGPGLYNTYRATITAALSGKTCGGIKEGHKAYDARDLAHHASKIA